MSPILTVVVPTVDRPQELRLTLLSIANNYPLNPDTIKFFVFDNGSSPSVAIDGDVLSLFRGNLSLIRVDSTIPFRDSFAFCVSLSQSAHVQVFGDDDLAFGRLGFFICDILSENKDASLLYLNRLVGNYDLSVTGEVAHPALCSSVLLRYGIQSFIEKYTHWPSFISSLVFSVDAWLAGCNSPEACNDRYIGYEFLHVLYKGCVSTSVLVLGMPLLIQRRGLHKWKPFWPLFWLQSMRRILSDLDSDQITTRALDNWIRSEIKPLNLCVDLLICSSNPSIYGRDFWDELFLAFSPYRRLLPFLLIRFFPVPLSRVILNASPNSFKYFLGNRSSSIN